MSHMRRAIFAAVAICAGMSIPAGADAATGPSKAVKEYLTALESNEESVRLNAIRGLQLQAGRRGQHLFIIPALLGALEDASPMVRSTSAEALRTIFRRPEMPESRAVWEELWLTVKDRYEAEQRLDPQESLKRERAKLQSERGYYYMFVGNFKAAEPLFQEAVQLDSANPQYWNNLGKCHFNQGRIPDAIDKYRQALLENALYSPAHFNLADAFLSVTKATGNDRTYEALGHIEVALRLDNRGEDWAARWLKARILLEMAFSETRAAERREMYRLADEAIAEAIRMAPKVAEVRKTAAIIAYARELHFKSYQEVQQVYDLGYRMDEDFMNKLDEALRRQAHAIGARPPRMPATRPDKRPADELSPALFIPYIDGPRQ